MRRNHDEHHGHSKEREKTMNKRWIARIVMPILVAASAPWLVAGSIPEVGNSALPLELKSSDGQTYSLAKAEGTTLLIFYRGLW